MLRQTLRVSPLPFPSFFPSYCDVPDARSLFYVHYNSCPLRVTWPVHLIFTYLIVLIMFGEHTNMYPFMEYSVKLRTEFYRPIYSYI
jgi:hypothetical protein